MRSSTSAVTAARSSARARGGARRSSARTTRGRTASTAGSSPRRAANKEGGIDKDELGLVPLPPRDLGAARLRQPGSRTRSRSHDYLDGIPERVADAGIDLDALRFLQRSESELDCNWKISAENFLECYHCPTAHPGFSAVMDVCPDAYLLETNAARMTQHSPPRPRAARRVRPDGRGRARPVPPPLPRHRRSTSCPDGRTSRSARSSRATLSAPTASSTTSWPRMPTRHGSRSRSRSTPRSARRISVLIERVQAGMRAGLIDGRPAAAGVREARSRTSRRSWSTRSPESAFTAS